jgi:hypothetical protein
MAQIVQGGLKYLCVWWFQTSLPTNFNLYVYKYISLKHDAWNETQSK